MKASGSSATSSPSKGTTDGRVLDEGTIRRQQGQVKGGSLAARIQSAQAKNADRPGSAEDLPYVDAPLQKVRYTKKTSLQQRPVNLSPHLPLCIVHS
jgi:hypothetical protein